ncbi:MAG: hypothetical protein ACK559_30185, partial [bacterium]
VSYCQEGQPITWYPWISRFTDASTAQVCPIVPQYSAPLLSLPQRLRGPQSLYSAATSRQERLWRALGFSGIAPQATS